MVKKILALAGLLPTLAIAQNYNVALIPDSLKDGVNAVKRLEELHVVIKSPGKAVIKHKYAITILNENGDGQAQYENTYDKLVDLSDISGALYDASGKKLRSVKKKDLADAPVEDGYSLIIDDRKKTHDFSYRTYPYTIEYEDEQEFNGLYFLPFWEPMEDEKFSVQQSSFVVEAPANYKLRFKQYNYPGGQPAIGGTGDVKTYTWSVSNIKGFQYEPLQPAWAEVTPSVFLGASDFNIGGYTGNMDTWLGLGKFQVALNQGRDELPDNVKQEVHKLTDGLANIHEKINALYGYLQNNSRYVSIQLGIGGWQPFDAKYVASKKYGDCKALSNFMVSLLKEAGVKANYVLINAGDGRKGLNEDFPAPYFNHVVACVPNGTDTTWLECTSQTEAPGYMGTFTGDRKALLISDDGGHVVNTPIYTANDNVQLRKISAKIDAEGNLLADVNTHFAGIQQEEQHWLIHQASKEQRDKHLNSTLNLPTYSIDKYDYKEERKAMPVVDEYLHVISPSYATLTGKRLFLQPNLFNKSTMRFSEDKTRRFDIKFSHAYRDVDTVNIIIPEGYALESKPSDVSIQNEFGNYSINYVIAGNVINVIRVNQRNVAIFPAADYPQLVKFYDDIYKADRSKIVFVKKDS